MTARIGTLPRKYAVRRWVATGLVATAVALGFVAMAGSGSDATTPVPRTPDTFVAAMRGPDLVAVVTAPVETTAPETAPVEVPVQTPVAEVPQEVPVQRVPAPVAESPAPAPCMEDEPCWDPCTMGNRYPCDETPAPVPPTCQEDEPCWNECTMGNLGPCDGTSLLPNGARFSVTVEYDPRSEECWQGWVLTHVTVYVVGAEGGVLATGGVAVGCAPGGDAYAPNGVGSMLPTLYHQAASAL